MKGNPRYALVRVDGTTHCPSRYEKINRNFVCSGLPHWYKCKYGDTKQQLIAKVQQPLFKRFMELKKTKAKGLKKKVIAMRLSYKLALEIIEFMGVK